MNAKHTGYLYLSESAEGEKWWHLYIMRELCMIFRTCSDARLYSFSMRLSDVSYYQLPKWWHLFIKRKLRAYSNAQDKKSKQLATRLKDDFEGLTICVAALIDRELIKTYIENMCREEQINP